MGRHCGGWVLVLFWPVAAVTFAAGPTTSVSPAISPPADSALPDVRQALAATRDVWGELAMRQRNGPSYRFFEKLLPPLRYVDCPFRHYPIALASPQGRCKARFVSNGSGVNLPGARGDKRWRDYPLGLTFHVGDGGDPYGSDLSRLIGPSYERGYLPIVQTRYRLDQTVVAQEAFVPIDGPLADHAAVLLRFSLPAGSAPVSINVELTAATPARPGGAGWVDDRGRTLLWLGAGWNSDASARRVSGTLNPGEPLLLAVASAPLETAPGKLDDATYQDLRGRCAAAWDKRLDHAVRLEVPEERVNRAWKSTLIANLMMATGDEMSYSAGNVYQRLYEAESGDAVRALMLYGLTDLAKQMTNPLLRYQQKGLAFHDAAFRLQLLAHVYWITRDAEFVRSRRDLWQPSVDLILNQREKDTGLLPKENYCGDISTQVYSLNSNANCWRGLRDIAAILRDLGEVAEADRLASAAAEFHAAILAALDKSERRDVTPPFVPVALFGAEPPHERLTDTKLGSYWDLMIPYVLGSQILDDRRETAVLDYLHTRGGICMGMIRFDQHSGLFANENGVDDLYGLRYDQTLLRRDDVDRALVSFYGKLAQGMTRDTFVDGEGTGLIPLDANGRPMYLPPNASGNAFFLTLLRDMLVQDHDADGDGRPDTLRLLFATPRAWLEDGKTVRLERAPTAFGPVSVVARSELSRGRVAVDVTPPPRAPAGMKLRVRLPDGWKATAASVEGAILPAGGNATIDLPARKEPFRVDFTVSR